MKSGFVAEVGRSRAVPGTRLLRIVRVGRTLHAPVAEQMGNTVKAVATQVGSVLRVNIELFDEDSGRRHVISESLARAGFRSVPARSYRQTLRVDLMLGKDAVFARLSRSTRRNVRQATNHGLFLAPLSQPEYLEPCRRLYEDAFRRTGAAAPPLDISRVLASANGSDACLLGVFLPGGEPMPERLLAFAWVRSHGDYATYDVAASVRGAATRGATPGDLLMHGCIEWAMHRGHRWLDLGGVTFVAEGASDALAGISAFKYGFSRERISVGEEWELRPSAWLSTAERVVQRVRSLFRS